MPEQLTFDLPVRVSRSRGDFFVSEANALAVARLEMPGNWPNGKLVLVGPQGSGKTHLAHVWAEANGAKMLDLSDVLDADIPAIDSALVIETHDPMGPDEEEAMFHLHNHMQTAGLPLLLIARTPPSHWDIRLPDLKSRMEATDIVQIAAPDDALLAAVLVKQFTDRQLDIAPAVISFLVTHMQRSFREAERVVAELDRRALSEGRAITRPLAQSVLDNAPRLGP